MRPQLASPCQKLAPALLRRGLLVACASSALLAGCTLDFNAAIPCDSNENCPGAYVCDENFSRCIKGDRNDERDTEEDTEPEATDDVRDADSDDEDSSEDGDVEDVDTDDSNDSEETDSDVETIEDVNDGSGDSVDDTEPDSDTIECIPLDEFCDGQDNDCDTDIDEGGVCDGICPVGMQTIDRATGGRYCIDTWEASRADATISSAGSDDTAARSADGKIPWSTISKDGADAACRASGKRLCTGAEWQSACQGDELSFYPYGNAYRPDGCNGGNIPPLDRPTPTGQFVGCVSSGGTFDQSGNLGEWTDDGVLRGGWFSEPQLNLRCSSRAVPLPTEPPAANYGFRCCADLE